MTVDDKKQDPDAAPAHEWFQFSNLVACKACGVVRRADDKNSPCKGPVRVALRDTDAAPAVCVWTETSIDPLGYAWLNSSCGLVDCHERDVLMQPDPQKHCPSCGKPIKFTEAK